MKGLLYAWTGVVLIIVLVWLLQNNRCQPHHCRHCKAACNDAIKMP